MVSTQEEFEEFVEPRSLLWIPDSRRRSQAAAVLVESEEDTVEFTELVISMVETLTLDMDIPREPRALEISHLSATPTAEEKDTRGKATPTRVFFSVT